MLNLLVLLALMAQYQPLRVCAVEQWLTGSNCHERDHALSSVGCDAIHHEHGTHSPQGECKCDVPRESSERQRRVVTHVDAPLLALPLFQSTVADISFDVADDPAHPVIPPPEISLPLLL